MSQYRAVLKFCTSGYDVVEVTTEWKTHRDAVEEVVEALEPFMNKERSFVGYEIEMREVIHKEE